MTQLKPEIPKVTYYGANYTTMPDWVREGDTVAVICNTRNGADSVRFRKVTRATAKFVTVDDDTTDGMRFSLIKGLRKAGEEPAYGPRYYLADPNADATKFARALYRLENLGTKAGHAANAFARKPTRENAREAAAAFQAYVEADAKLVADQEAWLDRQNINAERTAHFENGPQYA